MARKTHEYAPVDQVFVFQVPGVRSLSVAVCASDRESAKNVLDSHVKRPLEWCLVVQKDRPRPVRSLA